MAKNTSISLGPHFDKFIEKQLKSGRYSTASEVVRESLRLLEEQEKNKAALRKALIAGEKSGIAGPIDCLLYSSPSPRDQRGSRMPSSA